MQAPELRELALLSEREALLRHFAGRNWVAARAVFFALAGTRAVETLSSLLSSARSGWAIPAANLAVLVALALWSRVPSFERRFPALLAPVLALQLGGGMLLEGTRAGASAWSLLLAIVVLLVFRLRPGESLLVASSVVVAQYLRLELHRVPFAAAAAALWPAVVLVAAVAGIGLWFTWRQARSFLVAWRAEGERERERRRLEDELASARAVQVAMLPERPPTIEGLEIDAVSLPASEVGGDYFDFLALPDGKWALVIGDVAGHGMASGLVLSGVHAGLLLLRPELAEPERALGRLDEGVRDFGRRRLLMTLTLAVWNPATGILRLANAGHLPPLCWRAADGRVEAIALPSPPLGTRLGRTFPVADVATGAGDLWLFYSDGLVEAADAAGEAFGEARLGAALAAEARRGRSLAEMRAALLETVAAHRRGLAAADDQTLMLVRVTGGGAR